MVDAVTVSSDQQKNECRSYSLDYLRIIAMIMIVCLHIGSHGGLSTFYGLDSANGILLQLLSICCTVAVNVYVLISGFFLVTDRFRISRLIKLCLEVIFYSWLFGLISYICGASYSLPEYLGIIFPISYKGYWFITAYFGVSILSPFLNKFINCLNKKTHLAFCLVLLFMYSVIRDVLIKSDPFDVAKGYSLAWFIVVYSIAAYLRKYVDKKSVRLPLVWYFCCCACMFLIWLALTFLAKDFGFIDKYGLPGFWCRYNSIFNISASVFIFIFFWKKQIKRKSLIRVIAFLSPLTLGVYLIHDNLFFSELLWDKLLNVRLWENNAFLIPKALFAVICIFLACIAFDYLRKIFFDSVYKKEWFIDAMIRADEYVERQLY